MKINNAICYSYSLNGEDPLAHLRLIGPLRQSGINIIKGIENNQFNTDKIPEVDLVIIQREIPQEFNTYKKIIELAHKEGKPVIFDLDDLLFCLPENHPDRQSTVFAPSLLPMLQALLEVDLVTVSTPKLRDFAINYNNNVSVFPNYFDDNLWRLRSPILNAAANETLTIGYMGGSSHAPDLEYITPVLLDLIKRYPRKIALHFWGVEPPVEIASLPQVKWTPSVMSSYRDFSIYFQNQKADIFIAPLIDSLFNRCKSPIKFFEYSALGAPGVFSHLETYAEVVTHGQNGLLASTLDEWADCLSQLIDDKERRFQLATNAQETIRSNWLLSRNAYRWKETFQNINLPTSTSAQKRSMLAAVESIIHQQVELFEKKETVVNVLKARVVETEQAADMLTLQLAQKEQAADMLTLQLAQKEQAITALTTQVTEKEQSIAALRTQVAEKEQAVAALMTQVAEQGKSVAALTARLSEIQGSTAWRTIQFLRKIRIVFIPHGSRRERLLYLAVRAVFYIKHHGTRSFLRRAVEQVKQKGVIASIHTQPDLFTITAQDGKLCPLPTISIVIEKNRSVDLPSVSEADVLAWVKSQTIRGTEVVVWESEEGKAVTLGEPLRTWDAPTVEELCRSLAGRYLCMASPDLLQRNQVYLESNLIALECEDLAYTVNGLGKPDWLLETLKNNRLPGNRTLPYLRQIIRTDCVGTNFSLDISKYLMKRQDMSAVAGKIIIHTTAYPDTDHPFPSDTLLAETVEWKMKGNYILARSNSQVPWEPLVHVVHPVNTVIPISPEPSDLPTVVIFMPFLAVGGAERLALQLMRHLKDQVRFIVVTVEGMDASLGTTADAFHQLDPFVYTAADYLLPPLNFSLLIALIERFQPTTFYIANGSNFIYDAMGMLHQLYPDLRIVNQVYDHQFGWINRYDSTVVAAISAHISANPNISRAYTERGVPSQQICFVEHAVDLGDVNPADYPVERCIQIKQKLGLPLGKKIVTFCARLHPQKRPVDFIEMVRRFSAEEGIHFLMVGDGPLAAAVEEQAVRTGLKNFSRFKFYSPISDIYAITDVMVLPSEYEAMPMVILETLAMGKPVVATDVGHIRDVVEMTHGGIVVTNIGDVGALRTGVLQALRESFDPIAMRQIIDQRFGISKIARQYLKVWTGESDG